MGGGFSTAALLAQVSNAGGLGSIGAYTLTPQEIQNIADEVGKLTTKPYNINLWVKDVDDALANFPQHKIERIKTVFKPFFDELDIELPELSADIASKFEQQVETLFRIKPAVFSFVFGIPSEEILKESRKLGIKTIGAATTLDEALALEDAKVDAIVASGFEAGGHRPSFLKPAQDSFTGLFMLIQQIKARTKTPIIATGGIIDPAGMKAAFALGADAVQMGTAFLATEESGATPLHRKMLFSKDITGTTVTKSLTGRFGRMIPNTISTTVPSSIEVLPFPLQTKLIAPLRTAAMAQGREDLISFWSGQNRANLHHHHASEVMKEMIEALGN